MFQISTAFQVFQSLGTQEKEVNLLLEKILAKVKSSAEKALDAQSLNQSSSQEKNTKTKGKVLLFLNWLLFNTIKYDNIGVQHSFAKSHLPNPCSSLHHFH